MLTQFLKNLKAGKELPKRDFLRRIASSKLPVIRKLLPSIKYWKFNKKDDDVWLVH